MPRPDPAITIIAVTARGDEPFPGNPEWSVFAPVLVSLTRQDDPPPFEVVFVDARHGQRKRGGPDSRRPFPVKWIPPRPNPWHPIGLPAMGAQLNTGLFHARGEIAFVVAESCMFPPWFLRRLWEEYKSGHIPVAWYVYDLTFAPDDVKPPRDCPPPYDKPKGFPAMDLFPGGLSSSRDTGGSVTPEGEAAYRRAFLGHRGDRTFIDHRYFNAESWNPVPWQWFFGYSTIPLEAAEKVNGFDENFDGQMAQVDCDLGSRLEMAGYGDRFRMFRDIFVVEAYTDWNSWGEGAPRKQTGRLVRCNYGLLEDARQQRRIEANRLTWGEEDSERVRVRVCASEDRVRADGSHTARSRDNCLVISPCKANGTWPFGPTGDEGRELYEMWLLSQSVFDLAEERRKARG